MKHRRIRRVSVKITSQTLYHLNYMAAISGWDCKDIGRVIDKLVRSDCVWEAYR